MSYSIRLNKQNKTIKIVNRRENIRLQHIKENNIRLGHNSGKPGPKGDQGDPGAGGDQGVQGLFGGNTVGYYFTSDYTPEGIYDGVVRFNEGLYYHTDYSYVTEIYLSRKDFTSLDVSGWIESLDDSTDPVKGHIRIFSLSQSSNFVVFKLFGLEEHENYYTLFVEPVYSLANFSGAAVGVSFSRTGDKGTLLDAGGEEVVSDKHYTQAFTVSDEILVPHNLGKYPAVSILDSAGDEVEGDISFVSPNSVIVRFTYPFSGSITCN